MRNGQIDGGERPCGQDGSGNDDARGRLLADYQKSPHAEHGRLQHHAQYLREGAKAPDDVARAPLTGHILPVGLGPAMHHMADHPHRHDRFGVSVACLREFAARHGKARNGFGRPSCEHLGEEGQRYKDDGATECSVAEPGVQQVANTDVER